MYRMSAFRVVTVVGVLVLFSAASPSPASTITGDPVSLKDLFRDGSIVAGDKLFDQFSYTASGNMPDASDVYVVPIVDDDGNFGLRFKGAFGDRAGHGDSDALIAYRVMTTNPGYLISDVHLAGNPFVVGKEGAVAVVETFLFDDLALSIFDFDPGPRETADFGFLTTPVQTLYVEKNILAFAKGHDKYDKFSKYGKYSKHDKHGKHGGFAGLTYIDQTFSQVVVPEPSTISLLMLGLGAAWRLRRKSGNGLK